MAITMNGRTFRTLSDGLYLNGRKVVLARVGNTKVYPDDALAKVNGSHTWQSNHTHNGDADQDARIGTSVNSMTLSYEGIFVAPRSVTDSWIPTGSLTNFYRRVKHQDRHGIRASNMESLGYGYVKYGTGGGEYPNYIESYFGTNDYFSYKLCGGTLSRVPLPISDVTVDIAMDAPTFCPIRAYYDYRLPFKYGFATGSVDAAAIAAINGKHVIPNTSFSEDYFPDSSVPSARRLVLRAQIFSAERDAGVDGTFWISAYGDEAMLILSVPATQTVHWEYQKSGSTVEPINITESYQVTCNFSESTFRAFATSVEML